MANTLSRSLDTVPSWLVQSVVGVVLAVLVAWASWATATAMNHETRIVAQETKMTDIKDDIHEIKEGQKLMNDKLDRLIERQGR